jgi:spermidine/putrescine transport system substrate-binding protein
MVQQTADVMAKDLESEAIKARLAGRRISRGDFLKGISMVAGATAIGGGFLSACAAPGSSSGESGNVLNVLSWPGHGDPEFVGPFEEQHGVKVKTKEYVGGDQALSIINSTPPGTFDCVLLDAEYVPQVQQTGRLMELDPADYPFNDFFPEFRKFETHWFDNKLYAVMLRFGYLGLAYNSDKLSEDDVKSYEILWDEKVKGRVGWFDWYLTSMGPLSLYKGNRPPYDIDEAAFLELQETLFSLKPQSSGFHQMAEVFSTLTNQQAWVVPGVGDWVALLLQEDGHPIRATVPEEGGLQWTESLSIFKDARNPELAKKFIQYATTPEAQVRTATLSSYSAAIPSKKGWELMAKQKPEWAKRLQLQLDGPNVMDVYREGKIFIRKTPVQQTIEEWNNVWTEFKSL